MHTKYFKEVEEALAETRNDGRVGLYKNTLTGQWATDCERPLGTHWYECFEAKVQKAETAYLYAIRKAVFLTFNEYMQSPYSDKITYDWMVGMLTKERSFNLTHNQATRLLNAWRYEHQNETPPNGWEWVEGAMELVKEIED